MQPKDRFYWGSTIVFGLIIAGFPLGVYDPGVSLDEWFFGVGIISGLWLHTSGYNAMRRERKRAA